jgi:predicted nucleic acid-binding protein
MMKKFRIYVDTSVIGGCFDPEFATWSNGLFKDFENGIYRPVLSEIVAFEIEKAPTEVIEKYFELLNCQIEIIDLTHEVTQLANVYLERQILTPKYLDDARHIALATVHNIDMLVSWNFRHLVHVDKMRRFNAVNLELGYRVIEIRSPREVITYGT